MSCPWGFATQRESDCWRNPSEVSKRRGLSNNLDSPQPPWPRLNFLKNLSGKKSRYKILQGEHGEVVKLINP